MKSPTYPGIQMSYANNIIRVFDYSSTSTPITLNFQDFIGQPTWIAPYTLSFKTVLRGDINLGDIVQMPQVFAQKGLVLTTAQSQSQYKRVVDFQGNFRVQSIRHLGMFRQGSADSWVTVFQAYSYNFS